MVEYLTGFVKNPVQAGDQHQAHFRMRQTKQPQQCTGQAVPQPYLPEPGQVATGEIRRPLQPMLTRLGLHWPSQLTIRVKPNSVTLTQYAHHPVSRLQS